ncbi:LPXTG cell wall anchor domain-containing protein [Brochothrix thermosphacta]|uniref:LPXTG cell wall anchor domain-containing protein n=1 Tax=Brochothrix thermosphacta TaxID=2756 RepID=UPI001146DF62
MTNEHPYSNKSNVQKLGSQKNSLPQTGEERCLTFVWGSILIVSASLLMKNKKRKKE